MCYISVTALVLWEELSLTGYEKSHSYQNYDHVTTVPDIDCVEYRSRVNELADLIIRERCEPNIKTNLYWRDVVTVK